MNTPLQELATEVLGMFETAQRDNGDYYYRIKSDSPEWVTDMCHDGAMSPDDYTFEYVVSALNALASNDDPGEAYADIEIYPCNSDRLKWLASNAYRIQYVDDAVAEYGIAREFSVMDAIGLGRCREQSEIFDIVRSALEKQGGK